MEFFNSLDKKSSRYQEINDTLNLLRTDYSMGDKIPRNLWPRKYVREHQVHTLFRYKLRSGWRLVYTVYGTKHEKNCTVLEAFDHKEYEKRFGY
ncbi:MAG: hypothetical protein WCC52_07060 [Nitrosotalea sp.]